MCEAPLQAQGVQPSVIHKVLPSWQPHSQDLQTQKEVRRQLVAVSALLTNSESGVVVLDRVVRGGKLFLRKGHLMRPGGSKAQSQVDV